jgi:hypothetical protein
MINVQNLRIGDVCGTTSLNPLTMMIKWNTWGKRYIFDQTKASHVTTVVTEHGLNYFMEMLSKGIHQTDINEYDHSKPFPHICFVGRHSAFEDIGIRNHYNEIMLELHEKHVKYGWEDLINFVLVKYGLQIKDNPNRNICSVLPRIGFKHVGISYPYKWDIMPYCSPMDWQLYKDPRFTDITNTII